MSRVILDHNAPVGLRHILRGHEVVSAYAMGWEQLSNGALLAAAEQAGFDIMVTGDRSIEHQNRMTGRKLAIVALNPIDWLTVRLYPETIREAVGRAAEGSYVVVSLQRRPIRRRPPPDPILR